MSHRDRFARLAGEMDRLLREIDALRVGRETTPELDLCPGFEGLVARVGARDWSGQIAANDEPITRAHVERAESMVAWAMVVASILRGDPPDPPHPTPPPPSTPPPYAQAMAFGARGR